MIQYSILTTFRAFADPSLPVPDKAVIRTSRLVAIYSSFWRLTVTAVLGRWELGEAGDAEGGLGDTARDAHHLQLVARDAHAGEPRVILQQRALSEALPLAQLSEQLGRRRRALVVVVGRVSCVLGISQDVGGAARNDVEGIALFALPDHVSTSARPCGEINSRSATDRASE